MTLIKTRNYILLGLAIYLIGCNNTGNIDAKNVNKDLPKYELVKDWPQLPKGYVLSQVTGVGIDTNQNIFLFHRTG